jgi:hypothetical protein
MSDADPARRRRLLIHLALAAATVAVTAPILGRGLMLYDLGELLWMSARWTGDGIPGVDFVVNGYGPGRYLLVGWLFELLGEQLAVVWVLFLVLRLGATAVSWELSRRFMPDRISWLPTACLILAPAPLHKGFFVLGSLAVALTLVAWLQAPRPRRALVFGLVLAAVGLFRLDLGGFGALAFLVTLPLVPRERRWGGLVRAALPGLAVLTTVAVWLGSTGTGALAAVGSDVLADARVNQGIRHPSFPPPWSLLRSLEAWLLWLPLPGYLLLAALVFRRRRDSDPTWRSLFGLLLLGVLCCNQVLMKPEPGHLLQAAPLLWIGAYVVAGQLRRGGAALAVALPILLLAAVLGPLRGDLYAGSFTIGWDRDVVTHTRLGRVRLNPGEAEEIVGITDWLAAQPAGALWVPTNQPLLYALSGRADVTGHPTVLYFADDPHAAGRVVDRLEASPPPLAVFIDDTVEGPERRLDVAAPAVHGYLMSHYRQVGTAGRARLMRRR